MYCTRRPATLAREVSLGQVRDNADMARVRRTQQVSTGRADPSALRYLLGHDLRTTRERAGVTQVAAGAVIGSSPAKINYLETGKTQQKPDEVVALLRAYGADVAHVDRMASLAGRADQGTWWAPFSDVLPDWFKTFVGLEGLAVSQFAFSAQLLPGQFQIPDYAAALFVGTLHVVPLDAPQLVKARMARQRLMDETAPLNFRAVIEESVLNRRVGGDEVMTRQLEHLLMLMGLEHVEIHVMPSSVAVHDALDGDFIVLDFDEAQSIAYIEYSVGALYVQDPSQVGRYATTADRLCDAALSVGDTQALIRSRIAKLNEDSEEQKEGQ